MTGSDARGCDNCESLLDLMKTMNEKLSQFDDRFNGMETLMKAENEKLRNQLEKANKRYEEVCEKVNVMATEINRLKQINLSRNIIIKGVPEVETDAEHLKSMISLIFAKLRYNLQMTFVDCFRIGKKTETTCRPIIVVLPSVGVKNMMIRDKRSVKMTCANFSNDGIFWGTEDQIIYIDEHLTRENHMLFMSARKLKQLGFKFVWTRNGRVFVRFNEKTKIIGIDSISQLAKLTIEAKSYEKHKEQQTEEDIPLETDAETEPDAELESDLDKYRALVDNSPQKRSKRKKNSPQGHSHDKGPKRQATRGRKGN